jgi:MSHA pilin protein MshA
MKPGIKSTAQGGSTLIELIVVIVILGILAATALPKFASLGGDARVASLNGARGALTATAAMAHAKWLVNPASVVSNKLNVEGQDITMLANGYPAADSGTALAAGLAATDYTVFTAATGTNPPTVPADSMVIVPTSIVGTTSATKCFIVYTVTASTAPVVALNSEATAANCN